MPPEASLATQHDSDRDILCLGCRYNLRGLAAEGVCPECGLPIARSLSPGGFRLTNHRWLGHLHFAAWLLLVTTLLLDGWSMLPPLVTFSAAYLPVGVANWVYWFAEVVEPPLSRELASVLWVAAA